MQTEQKCCELWAGGADVFDFVLDAIGFCLVLWKTYRLQQLLGANKHRW